MIQAEKIKAERYYITGVNRLTGAREIISRDMTLGQAMRTLDRECNKRLRAWTRLKAIPRSGVQLTIKFNDYGKTD